MLRDLHQEGPLRWPQVRQQCTLFNHVQHLKKLLKPFMTDLNLRPLARMQHQIQNEIRPPARINSRHSQDQRMMARRQRKHQQSQRQIWRPMLQKQK